MTVMVQLLRALRRWLQNQSNRNDRIVWPEFRPLLEFLEDRTVPALTQFTWVAAADANWNVATNWEVNGQPATQFPDSADHIVVFDKMNSNKSVTVNNARTVGAIERKTDMTLRSN